MLNCGVRKIAVPEYLNIFPYDQARPSGHDNWHITILRNNYTNSRTVKAAISEH